jgi:hypothetical protein
MVQENLPGKVLKLHCSVPWCQVGRGTLVAWPVADRAVRSGEKRGKPKFGGCDHAATEWGPGEPRVNSERRSELESSVCQSAFPGPRDRGPAARTRRGPGMPAKLGRPRRSRQSSVAAQPEALSPGALDAPYGAPSAPTAAAYPTRGGENTSMQCATPLLTAADRAGACGPVARAYSRLSVTGHQPRSQCTGPRSQDLC